MAFCGFENRTADMAAFETCVGNYSAYNNSEDLKFMISYCCDSVPLENFIHETSYVANVIGLTFIALGLPGHFLILSTISWNKEFDANCFWIHKAVATLEILHTPLQIAFASYSVVPDQALRSYWFLWFSQYLNKTIGNVFPDIVTTLTIFLAMNRVVATLLPTKFHSIEQWQVYVSIFCFSVLSACAIYIPSLFACEISYDFDANEYGLSDTDMVESTPYVYFQKSVNIFIIFRIGVGIVATVLSVAGMLKARHRR